MSKHGEECSEHDGLSQHDQIDREEQEHMKQKLPGQQSIKSYFRVEKAQKQGDGYSMEDRHRQRDGCNMEDRPSLKTSDIVTSDEGRKRLTVVGNDVVRLFPAMKEVSTGRAVGRQVFKSPMVGRGLDYLEVCRYVAGSIKLC